MRFLVDQPTSGDAGDFVDAVAELQRAILDMHARLSVWQITAIDIGNAPRGRAR